MLLVLECLLLLVAVVAGFFLLVPFISTVLTLNNRNEKLQPVDFEYSLGCIITAYKQAEITIPLVESLLKQQYENYHIYLVADDCADIALVDIVHPRLHILSPATALSSKVKSILYAMDNYADAHDFTIILDSDNLAHPEYLQQMNASFNAGFKAVQGKRIAKNLDSLFACLDAMGEYYYDYDVRRVPVMAGSSATIAGSGMGVDTTFYRQALQDALAANGPDKVIVAEDKILQAELVQAGYRIGYNNHAVIYDEKVGTGAQVQRQRARWINSYFKYMPYALGVLLTGIKRLNFNQVFFGYLIVYPPLFILTLVTMLTGVALLFINLPAGIILFTCLLVFIFNFFYTLKLNNAPAPIWKAVRAIPFFMVRQILAMGSIKTSNKDFLVTEKSKKLSIEDILASGKKAGHDGRINIMHVIRQGTFGGGETYLYNLVKRLDSTRFNVTVVSFSAGQMTKQLQEEGFSVHVIGLKGFYSPFLVRSLFSLIRRQNIHLVHMHGTKAAFNAVSAARLAGVKSIYTVHGWSFHPGQSQMVGKLRISLEKLIVKLSTKTVVVSDSNLIEGVNLGIQGNYEVIKNGIDTHYYNPDSQKPAPREDLGLAKSDFVIASIARLTYQKDPLTLIRAMEILKPVAPQVKLLFMGGGEMRQRCDELVKQLHLEEQVIFSNFTTDVKAYLAMIDLYILPSLWEGLSLGLLEAMAMERAIITSDYPSNTEVIDDKKNGLVFKTGDARQLADAILFFYGDRQEAISFGLEARKKALKEFDFKRVVSANVDLYYRMLPHTFRENAAMEAQTL